MLSIRPTNKGKWGLWLAAIFSTGLAVMFLDRQGAAVAQGADDKQTACSEEKKSSAVIALALQLRPGYDGIALIDRQNGTICIYQYAGTSAGGKLTLLATRNYRYDCQLEDYNTAEPGPAAVKELVERARKLKESHRPDSPQQD